MVVFSHESTIKFMSLRKNCPYSDLFWFVFSRIISPYSVRMPENKEQNNSEHRHFSRSMCAACELHAIQIIPYYFEAIEVEKQQFIYWFNYEILSFKEIKKRSSLYVFDIEKQLGLRQ